MSARTIVLDGFAYNTTAPEYRAVQHGLKGWCVEQDGEKVSAYYRTEAATWNLLGAMRLVAS